VTGVATTSLIVLVLAFLAVATGCGYVIARLLAGAR
jgi:hypothetical protein